MPMIRNLSVVGLLLGTLLFACSLTPSLLPRPTVVQGIVSGLSIAAGYGLGAAAVALWSYLQIPMLRGRMARIVQYSAIAICVVIALSFLWRAAGWQNNLRALMDLPPHPGGQPLAILLVALLLFAAILCLAWLIRTTARRLASHWLHGYIPQRVANVVGIAITLLLFWSIIDGIIFSAFIRTADRSFQQLDALVQDELPRPDDPRRTGSNASLIDWADVGRQGRSFLASGPDADELADFLGHAAEQPLRVYVGLTADKTPRARARLALRELQRINAFDRSVLLLVTPTGTGWIDPAAIDTLEYLYHGDVATVAAQYSYLPSLLTILTEPEYGIEVARALFDEVYNYWSTLAPDQRPALYLHGLSLGALNSDRSYDAYDIIADPFDGALWVGPPFRSPTWRHATAHRDPDSPAWLPRFRDGAVVRFMNQHSADDVYPTDWGPHRIALLQHASDPVTFFDIQSLYREPDWMRHPRGPYVSPELRWYPIVTFLQLAADIAVGGAPRGYGHSFAAYNYIDAWLALTDPPHWTDDQLQRLRKLHAERFPPER